MADLSFGSSGDLDAMRAAPEGCVVPSIAPTANATASTRGAAAAGAAQSDSFPDVLCPPKRCDLASAASATVRTRAAAAPPPAAPPPTAPQAAAPPPASPLSDSPPSSRFPRLGGGDETRGNVLSMADMSFGSTGELEIASATAASDAHAAAQRRDGASPDAAPSPPRAANAGGGIAGGATSPGSCIGGATTPARRTRESCEYDLGSSCGSMGESGAFYSEDSPGGRGALASQNRAPLPEASEPRELPRGSLHRPKSAPERLDEAGGSAGKPKTSNALVRAEASNCRSHHPSIPPIAHVAPSHVWQVRAEASSDPHASVLPPRPASASLRSHDSDDDEGDERAHFGGGSTRGDAAASSLLLARARASGGIGGANLLSVDDLFSDDDDADQADVTADHPPPASILPPPRAASDDDDDDDDEGTTRRSRSPKLVESRVEQEARARLEEELIAVRREIASLAGGVRVGGPRSEHANVREEGAALHWPPSESDYAADRTREDAEEERMLSRRSAPNAHRLFEAELEDHLTTLVMMMTLEARAVGRV